MINKQSGLSQKTIIFLTFLAGLVLTLMPMSLGLASWRPDWQLLVLMYWLIALPHRVSIGLAFLLGLVVDVLLGASLGIHAASYSIVAFPLARHYQRIRHFSMVQQSLLMGALVGLERSISFCIEYYLSNATLMSNYFWPVLSSAVMWPWLFLLLRKFRRHFEMI